MLFEALLTTRGCWLSWSCDQARQGQGSGRESRRPSHLAVLVLLITRPLFEELWGPIQNMPRQIHLSIWRKSMVVFVPDHHVPLGPFSPYFSHVPPQKVGQARQQGAFYYRCIPVSQTAIGR